MLRTMSIDIEMNFIFYFTHDSCNTLKSFTLFITVTKVNLEHSDKFEIKIPKIMLLQIMFSRRHRIWSFHAVVLQRTAKKSTKNYNASAALLLFCS